MAPLQNHPNKLWGLTGELQAKNGRISTVRPPPPVTSPRPEDPRPSGVTLTPATRGARKRPALPGKTLGKPVKNANIGPRAIHFGRPRRRRSRVVARQRSAPLPCNLRLQVNSRKRAESAVRHCDGRFAPSEVERGQARTEESVRQQARRVTHSQISGLRFAWPRLISTLTQTRRLPK